MNNCYYFSRKLNVNRKRLTFPALSLVSLLLCAATLKAQDQTTKNISLGFIFGDPIGVTIKCPMGNNKAMDISFGPDYFGSPRLQIDNVWRFDSFHSSTVKTYTGIGLGVAFGNGINIFFSKEPNRESFVNIEDRGFGFRARAIFGLNITPKSSLFEFFVEAGLLIGLNHLHELDYDGAIGCRIRL